MKLGLAAMLAASLAGFGNQPAHAGCIQDQDWPDKPCLDTPPYSEEYLKQVYPQYYEYKGSEWMEMKKAEMDQAIANGTLRQWVETSSAPDNFANNNVWRYYYLNDQAPDAYAEAEVLEPIVMTAASAGPRNSFEAKITWTPADLGQSNKFHVEVFDANQLEPRSPLAVRYDIKIYKGDKYLRPAEPIGNDAVQNEDFSHDYTFVFLQEGSYELAIEEIEHEGENIRIPIQVTPEFPIGMIGVVATVIGAGIVVSRYKLQSTAA